MLRFLCGCVVGAAVLYFYTENEKQRITQLKQARFRNLTTISLN